MGRSLGLALVAILLFVGYFALPTSYRIRKTMEMYITGFPTEWRFYRRNLDPEIRERKYNQLNFQIPLRIKQLLGEDDVAIIPPESYLLRYFSPKQIRWAEPRFIFYAAGPVRTVPWKDAQLESVTHAILVEIQNNQPRVSLMPVRTQEDFETVAGRYRGEPAP